MEISSLEIIINWMTQHAVWFNLFIFIVAMSESLLVVGLIVPGFLLMVGFGALIATGHLAFWPTTLIAIAGAIVGDGVSYWLGLHYKYQLQRMWPLSRYPSLIKQGQQFFNKHGKKSVMLGRFFGPLRAIVPTVAGMSNMPARQFYLSNIFSAIVWAPLYLLPGILFGMSLQLAKEFAGQITFIIIITIAIILIVTQIIRTLYGWLAPQADVLSYRLIIWARTHPILGSIPNSLVNPKQSEIRAITIFGFMLVFSALSFIVFNHYLLNTLLLNNIDRFIATQFVLLQHPFATKLAVFINTLSQHNFVFTSALLFAIWNFYYRFYKAIFFICAALLLPWAFVLLVNFFGLSFRAFNQDTYSATSLIIIAISVYGFITICLTKNLSDKITRVLYSLFFIFISFIVFSKLYLGLQSFSSLFGHFLFGCIWLAILGISYRRHPIIAPQKYKSATLVTRLITIVCVSLLSVVFIQNYQIRAIPDQSAKHDFLIGYDGWLETGWEILPSYRNDLRAHLKHPLNIQWMASENNIIETLNTSNWQQVENTTKQYLNWFKDTSVPTRLPIVKHIHEGEYNTLSFIKSLSNTRIAIIRLWPSGYLIQGTGSKEKLWVGEVAFSEIMKTTYLNYLLTVDDFDQTSQYLKNNLQTTYEIRTKAVSKQTKTNWNGEILLIKGAD